MASPTCTVLIVENFPPDRELYRRCLLTDTSPGYRLLEADTATEGLELCQTEAIDAILLDYALPDSNGLEFLQALKAQNCKESPPVVIVTGRGDESIAVQAFKLGAEDYLVKRQLTPDLLRLTVRGVLRNPQGQPLQMIGTVMDISERKQVEAALRDSEQRFRELFNTTYQFTGLLTPEGILLEANQTVLDFAGLTREEAIGRPFWEVRWWTISPQTQQQLQGAICRARQGEFVRYEVEILGAGETTAIIDFSLKPVRNESGQVVLLIPEGRDITEQVRHETERKRDEHRLRQSEARLQLGVQVAGVAIAQFHYASNQVTLSPEAAALFGIAAEEGIGLENGTDLLVSRDQIHAIFHPEDREELAELIQQALDPAGKGWFAREHRIVWKTGEIRWLNVRKQVYFDRSGEVPRPDYAILAAIDITDRKRAEAALLQSEERYRYLAGLIPQLVWIAAPTGALLDVNERWSEYTGLTLAQAQNQGWQGIVHPDDVPILGEAWMAAQASGTHYQASGRMRRADGVYRWHLHQAMPLRDERGFILKWFGTATDIDDMKQIEVERARLLAEAEAARQEAEAANRSKDELVALVAHELRSPLNAILGWARLLQTRELDAPTTARALETIARNTQAQVQLVEDLLDVSRMVRGTLQLKLASVNLIEVVEAALETVSPAAAAKQIQLLTQLQPVAPIWGDFHRLQQVILNLLTNAIKFTPGDGRVAVTLEPIAVEEQEGRETLELETVPLHPLAPSPPHPPLAFAQITVTDTGKGISPEFLPHVFQRFSQDQQNATTREGLGLGLAIVKHIVERHGGTVAVASAGVGQGATFTVRLPLSRNWDTGETVKHSSANSVTPDPPGTSSPRQPLAGLRVLLVDDEPDMLDLAAFALEEYGAIVETASSAAAALEKLPQFKPQILLSDIAMPQQDGYDLLRQVRSIHLEGQIPAIALTAYAGQDRREEALQTGFQRYLIKPLDPEDLVSTISGLMARSQER